MTFDHALAHEFSRRSALQLAGLGAAALALPRFARGDDKVMNAPPAGSEPKAFAQPTGFYRAKVGKLEVIAISDGALKLPIRPLFAPEGSDEAVRAVLEQNASDTQSATVQVNVMFVKLGSELILIDSGNGPGADGSRSRALANLAAAGIRPEQITGVVITHAHGDHLNGLITSDDKLALPNARVFVSKAEHDFWTGPKPDLSGTKIPQEWKDGWIAGTHKRFGLLKGKLELIKPGDKLLGGLEILDTAGHTPGHVSVVLSDGAEQLLISADLCHHPVLSFAKPDWTVGFDSDPKMAAATRKRMFDRASSERMRVFAYHMPWPGFGRVLKHGEGYVWVPEAWSWEP